MEEPRCFICGRVIDRQGIRYMGQLRPFQFKCPECERLDVLKNLRTSAAEHHAKLRAEIAQAGERSSTIIADKMQAIATQQELALKQAMAELSSEITSAMNGVQEHLEIINSTLTWGLQDILWQVQEQTTTLRSINETLTVLAQPSPLRNSHWYRDVADELSLREAHEDAIRYYRRSLHLHPLDYRTYIGLSFSLIATEQPERALKTLQKSLRFAPKAEIDYQSYSLRLMGRIYYALGDIKEAKNVLVRAVELSPNYQEAHYDLAQYAVQISDIETANTSTMKLLVESSTFNLQSDPHLAPTVKELHTQLLHECVREFASLELQMDAAYNLYRDIMNVIEKVHNRSLRQSYSNAAEGNFEHVMSAILSIVKKTADHDQKYRGNNPWGLPHISNLPELKNQLENPMQYMTPTSENYLQLKYAVEKYRYAKDQIQSYLAQFRSYQHEITNVVAKQRRRLF